MALPRVGFICVDKSLEKLLGARADKWLKIFDTMNIPTRASAFGTCVVPIRTVKPQAAVATEVWWRGGDIAFWPATRGVIRFLGDGGWRWRDPCYTIECHVVGRWSLAAEAVKGAVVLPVSRRPL